MDDYERARSPAHRRLIFEELFWLALGLLVKRGQRIKERKGATIKIDDAAKQRIATVLPFKLTEAQRKVVKEIFRDLRSDAPMNRLLQGDVGSGKTIVALIAMLAAMENGCQTALMVPTEILAEQHARNIKRILAKTPYRVELLIGSMKAAEKKALHQALAKGEIDACIGTHALIQEKVTFKKLGLATPLVLADAKIPVTNLVGNVGDGAKIAFNILNVGRFKLGASVTGGAKLAIHESVRYANERYQFGKPISSFGAIKHKLAEMAIRTWVSESITYRTVGMIDALIGDGADNARKMQSIEEYSVESSINKVACSEALDYVVDEMVQIYGGYGYSADYPAEKAYRDSRINRIFEGTNEINRMLIPGQLLKRAMKGKLGLLQAAMALQDEILNPQMSFDEDTSLLAAELNLAKNAKKVALMVLGTAAQKYMTGLQDQQEVLLNCADIIMDAYQMESSILRATKISGNQSEDAAARFVDMASVYCNDAIQRVEMKAKNTLAAIAKGDEARTLLAALKRFTKNNSPVNTIAARQRVADALIQANTYCF